MRTDKYGNKLFKKMRVKVIFPDQIFPDRTYVQHAGPRQGFGVDGIDQMLEQIADQLDTLYPWWQFRPVELAPIGSAIRFAFIFAGNNTSYVPPAPNQTPTDSTTPEPETAQTPIVEIASKVSATSQHSSSQELVKP